MCIAYSSFIHALSQKSFPQVRIVYSSFIHALSQKGDLQTGLEALKQMETEGLNPDGYHYSSLAIVAAQQNKIHESLEFVRMAAVAKVQLFFVWPQWRRGCRSRLV